MYICSFILFVTATSILCIGVKNCKKSLREISEYRKVAGILGKEDENLHFREHYRNQNNLNSEITKKSC